MKKAQAMASDSLQDAPPPPTMSWTKSTQLHLHRPKDDQDDEKNYWKYFVILFLVVIRPGCPNRILLTHFLFQCCCITDWWYLHIFYLKNWCKTNWWYWQISNRKSSWGWEGVELDFPPHQFFPRNCSRRPSVMLQCEVFTLKCTNRAFFNCHHLRPHPPSRLRCCVF